MTSRSLTSSDFRAFRQLGVLFLVVSMGWLALESVVGVWCLEDVIGAGILGALGSALTCWAAWRLRSSESESEEATGDPLP